MIWQYVSMIFSLKLPGYFFVNWQPDDTGATAGKTSRTSVQKKDGKVFFTSPRVKTTQSGAEEQQQQQPAWPHRSGKIVLKTSSKAAAGNGRKKQTAEPSWIDDDVFSFNAED